MEEISLICFSQVRKVRTVVRKVRSFVQQVLPTHFIGWCTVEVPLERFRREGRLLLRHAHAQRGVRRAGVEEDAVRVPGGGTGPSVSRSVGPRTRKKTLRNGKNNEKEGLGSE